MRILWIAASGLKPRAALGEFGGPSRSSLPIEKRGVTLNQNLAGDAASGLMPVIQIVLLENIAPKVAVEITPNSMGVIGLVLHVVVFD